MRQGRHTTAPHSSQLQLPQRLATCCPPPTARRNLYRRLSQQCRSQADGDAATSAEPPEGSAAGQQPRGRSSGNRRSIAKALSTAEESKADDKWALAHPADDEETAEGQLNVSRSRDGEAKRPKDVGPRAWPPAADPATSPPGTATQPQGIPAAGQGSGAARAAPAGEEADQCGGEATPPECDDEVAPPAVSDSIADTGASQWATTVDRSAIDAPGQAQPAKLSATSVAPDVYLALSNGAVDGDGMSGAAQQPADSSADALTRLETPAETDPGDIRSSGDSPDEESTMIVRGSEAQQLVENADGDGTPPSLSRFTQEFTDRSPTGSPASSMNSVSGSMSGSPAALPSSNMSSGDGLESSSAAPAASSAAAAAQHLADESGREAAGDGDSPISIPASAASAVASGSSESATQNVSESISDSVIDSTDVPATGGRRGRQLWNEAQQALKAAESQPEPRPLPRCGWRLSSMIEIGPPCMAELCQQVRLTDVRPPRWTE